MDTYHPQTIPELLKSSCLNYPNHSFLEYSNTSLTYQDVFNQTVTLANHFSSLGIHPGHHVAILLPNSIEFILSYFALMYLGAVMVPLNPSYLAPEIEYVLTNSESTHIITNESFLSRIPSNITTIFTSTFSSVSQQLDPLPDPNLSPDSLASILYTSGTTGKPKGVMLPHRSYTIGGESFAYRASLSHSDRMLVILPLFHVNAQIYSVMGGLVAGATLIINDSFHASTFWEIINQYQITQFNFLGVIANILLKLPPTTLDISHSLRLVCGAGLSATTIQEFRNRFHVPLLETYGLTEAPMGLSNMLNDFKEGSIGKGARHPNPNIVTKVQLIENEIVLKTPALALGYWNNPEATAESFRDGWFYTGDYGRVDSDGFYFFVDRKKDIIRKKGENISSREIELVIADLPQVVEVAVIPIPSPLGEDDIKAYIVLKNGTQLSATDVRTHCATHLNYQKTPTLIEFVSSLPKTPTNKLAKNLLKEIFISTQKKRLTPHVYLLDGIRTPIAKMEGSFKNLRPDELLAKTLSALSQRTNLSSADDLLVGCVNQVTTATKNIARQALLLSSLPSSIPATTINRLSASSLEATRLGYTSLVSGLADSVIVAGVESFSQCPESDRLGYSHLHPLLTSSLRSSGELIAQMAKETNISRIDQDKYAHLSNSRSLAAQTHLSSHVLPLANLSKDEIPRQDLTLERLSDLSPLYGESITAGNSSKLGDCAGAAHLVSASYLQKNPTQQPLVSVLGFALVAGDPADYGRLPVFAIQKLLNDHDLTPDHIGVWEIHEAYAAEALYVAQALRLRPERINQWGGAVSMGHPFGATGIRMLLSATHQLKTFDSNYAVITICIGGGQALACLLSRPTLI